MSGTGDDTDRPGAAGLREARQRFPTREEVGATKAPAAKVVPLGKGKAGRAEALRRFGAPTGGDAA